MLSQRAAVALAWLHIGGPRSRPPAAWATADQLSGSGRRVLGFPVSGACSGRGLPPPAPWFPGPPCCGLWAPLPPRGRRAARRVDSAPSIHPVSSPVDAHSVVSTCRLLGAAFSFPSRSRGCLSPWGQVGGGGGGGLRRGAAGSRWVGPPEGCHHDSALPRKVRQRFRKEAARWGAGGAARRRAARGFGGVTGPVGAAAEVGRAAGSLGWERVAGYSHSPAERPLSRGGGGGCMVGGVRALQRRPARPGQDP